MVNKEKNLFEKLSGTKLMSLIQFIFIFYQGDTESVMCDVIKILLKMQDERISGKGNP